MCAVLGADLCDWDSAGAIRTQKFVGPKSQNDADIRCDATNTE